MPPTYTGGCACGAVRYEIASDPLAQVHCQCRECQRVSGTGHASYLVFGGRDALTRSGETATWKVAGDSGNLKHHKFCPSCGNPVYLEFAAAPAMCAIHPGSLDTPAVFAPQMVTYTISGHDWDLMDPGLTCCEKGPR